VKEAQPARSVDPVSDVLKAARTIAVVGLSSKQFRPSYGVAEYLQSVGYRIIPACGPERAVARAPYLWRRAALAPALARRRPAFAKRAGSCEPCGQRSSQSRPFGGRRPVNPWETEVLGERAYARLEDIPESVDIVNIFRRSEFVPAPQRKKLETQERIHPQPRPSRGAGPEVLGA